MVFLDLLSLLNRQSIKNINGSILQNTKERPLVVQKMPVARTAQATVTSVPRLFLPTPQYFKGESLRARFVKNKN